MFRKFRQMPLMITIRKHEEQARFSPLRRLTTCITGCSLGLSEFLHKITNMILLCFHSPCFKRSEAYGHQKQEAL